MIEKGIGYDELLIKWDEINLDEPNDNSPTVTPENLSLWKKIKFLDRFDADIIIRVNETTDFGIPEYFILEGNKRIISSIAFVARYFQLIHF